MQNNPIYRKYTNTTRDEQSFKKAVISPFLMWQVALFLTGNGVWLFFQSEPNRPISKTHREMYSPYKVALHNAYIPTDKYIIDNSTYKTGKPKINPNPKFDPNGFWMANMLISLFLLMGFIHTYKCDKNNFDTIDMMVELEKFGKQYNLNSKQVKKLVSVSKDIIRKMSADKRVYFDMLLNGDINIYDNKTFVDMAVAILDGHLRTHKQDTERVLKFFAYNTQISEKLSDAIKFRTR